MKLLSPTAVCTVDMLHHVTLQKQNYSEGNLLSNGSDIKKDFWLIWRFPGFAPCSTDMNNKKN